MFVAVMKGRAHAAKEQRDLAIWQAWQGERFARTKKLKDLSEYLSGGSKEPVQPEVVLDAMLTLQAQGAAMTVRRVS
ncbi:hypothetical protein U1769_24150 [Sphingomonas sp. ZT3P38]|uniref:hypothetical protein n=1 Tax=Parasphingomonas zepuensis TaxID=3096161 RepID=UPI002FC60BC6